MKDLFYWWYLSAVLATWFMDNYGDNSGLMELMDELHTSRLSVENDRKAYDKVKHAIKLAEDKYMKLSEEWISVQKRNQELGEVIALRNSDIRLQHIKIQATDEHCNNLEDILQSKMNYKREVHRRRMQVLSTQLQDSGEFLTEWASTSHGKAYRKCLLENRCQMYEAQLGLKVKDLNHVVIAMRNLEQCVNEKNEMERQYKNSINELKEDEKCITSDIKNLEKKLSMLRKRQAEVKTPGAEMLSLTQQLEKTRESVSFWETRVAEIENDWLQSRKTSGRPKPKVPQPEQEISTNVEKNVPSARLPRISISEVDTGRNDSKDNTKSTEDTGQSDENDGKTRSSKPRVFQFKVKSKPPTEKPNETP